MGSQDVMLLVASANDVTKAIAECRVHRQDPMLMKFKLSDAKGISYLLAIPVVGRGEQAS
jgi:hypothetical protein